MTVSIPILILTFIVCAMMLVIDHSCKAATATCIRKRKALKPVERDQATNDVWAQYYNTSGYFDRKRGVDE